MTHYPEQRQSNLLIHENSEFRKLLSSNFSPDNISLANWATAPYNKNTNHPETLKYKTSSSYFVRSKSELIIDNMLTLNKIPFRYECCLDLNGIIVYPDFTIKHTKTEKIYYWEHFGMMDDPSYAQNAISKLQNYIAHGIYPTINLIITFETKDNPLNIDMIENIIKFYFL